MSKTLKLLIGARKLITPMEKWTQSVAARDKAGLNVDAADRRAVCWCSIGAVLRTANVNTIGRSPAAIRAVRAIDRAAQTMGYSWAWGLNDATNTSNAVSQRTSEQVHDAVLMMFDLAIETEKEKP